MPKKAPQPFSFHLTKFLENPHHRQIMFCKRLRIKGMLDIGVGAVLGLDTASIGLIKICRELYQDDKSWFVGSVKVLQD